MLRLQNKTKKKFTRNFVSFPPAFWGIIDKRKLHIFNVYILVFDIHVHFGKIEWQIIEWQQLGTG